MINLTTMTVQLIDGIPNGIRICRVEGEPLVAVVIPRVKLSEAARLPQLPPRGIYYLLDEDHGVLNRVYAGQTMQGLTRLESHKTRKDFWNKAVMFLDEDWNIDRDVLDSLEAMIIDYVRNHGSYETDNIVSPKPRLSPYKEQRVKSLHTSILFRMKALGYNLDRIDSEPVTRDVVFRTSRNGVHAYGRYNKDTGAFTVLAGSEVDLRRPVLKNQGAAMARERIFGNMTDKVVLETDLDFTSPSSAAVFVLGSSQNGWTEWLNEEHQSLDFVYRNEEQENK